MPAAEWKSWNLPTPKLSTLGNNGTAIPTANDEMRDRHLEETPPEKETSK